MIKKSSPPSPVGNLFTPSSLFHSSFKRSPKIAASFAFTLLCLVLGVSSSASAQTRAKRAGAKSEQRSRRVNETKRVAAAMPKESGKLVEVDETAQPHVRKTALSYPVRNGNQVAERPALTNDIVIISRAKESPASLNPLAPKAGASAVASNIPSVWPVAGTLRSGVGVRRNPFGGSSLEYHKGQDISAPMGTPVNATADGVVVIAGWLRGYGQVVYIDHGNGISTRYGHLSRIDVAVGQTVRRGGHLGLVGSTGRSTGPHLHYEVRINGQPTSPLPYLPAVAPATTPASPAATQGQGMQH